MLQQSLLFTGVSTIQIFNSPFPLIQWIRPHLLTYPSLCNSCVTYRMPCSSIGHQVLHFNHVPMLKYLIYFEQRGIAQQLLLMRQGLLQNIILTPHCFLTHCIINSSILRQMHLLSTRSQNLLVICVLQFYLSDNQ